MLALKTFRFLTRLPQKNLLANRMMSSYAFETLQVTQPSDYVLHVEINRPNKMNAMNNAFWKEILECFKQIHDDSKCRSVILSGAGKLFTAGIDLKDFQEMSSVVMSEDDVARKARQLHKTIKNYQASFTAIEECLKPVIAAVHGACIGGGVDLITACDIRVCTQDAYFTIKEVDLGLAADVGTLQRLPKIIGNDSKMRHLVYTSDKINSTEAEKLGLVSEIYPTKEEMMTSVHEIAKNIASKSPVAVQGSKAALNFSRDHSVQEGLAYMAQMNMTMLQSEDVIKSAMSMMTKDPNPPDFSKL